MPSMSHQVNAFFFVCLEHEWLWKRGLTCLRFAVTLLMDEQLEPGLTGDLSHQTLGFVHLTVGRADWVAGQPLAVIDAACNWPTVPVQLAGNVLIKIRCRAGI